MCLDGFTWIFCRQYHGVCGNVDDDASEGAVHVGFSTADSREDALSPLSEQQLADCDTVGSAYQDGLMDNGFDSVVKKAMNTEASQIHTATEGTCKISSCNVG